MVHNSKGGYPSLYHSRHFLNSDIVADLPNMFSGFLIDLTVIENETTVSVNQTQPIELFKMLLEGKSGAKQELEEEKGSNLLLTYVDCLRSTVLC